MGIAGAGRSGGEGTPSRSRALPSPRRFFTGPCTLMIMHTPVWLDCILIIALLAAACGGCLTKGGPEREGPTPAIPSVAPTSFVTDGGPDTGKPEESSLPAEMVHPFQPKGAYRAGDRILLSGTTILSPGNHILVEVTPVSFLPTKKSDPLAASGSAGVVVVLAGERGLPNTWSYLIDTRGWEPDEYQVKVQGVEVPRSTASFRFTLRP